MKSYEEVNELRAIEIGRQLLQLIKGLQYGEAGCTFSVHDGRVCKEFYSITKKTRSNTEK